MLFRTEYALKKNPLPLQPEEPVLSIGSCFAEEIGQKLIDHLMDCSVNPLGIAFNPLSLADLWEFNMKKEDLVYHNERWHSLKHHSNFSAPTREQLLEQIETGNQRMELYKSKAQLIIVSFGTAIIYHFKKGMRTVANCHKIPQKEFKKRRLGVEEVVARWSKILDQAAIDFPDTYWIFTVSPIRHLKDGFIENTRSKSILHLAVEELTRKSKAFYFPSFEIMMDDLRNYRYYNNDMLHPSSLAVDYIWEKFRDCYFSEELRKYLVDIAKLIQIAQHRPRFTSGREFQLLIDKIEQYKTSLSSTYPLMSEQIKDIQPNFNK